MKLKHRIKSQKWESKDQNGESLYDPGNSAGARFGMVKRDPFKGCDLHLVMNPFKKWDKPPTWSGEFSGF